MYTDAGLNPTLDGTAFSAYVSGGTAERVLTGTAFTSGDIIVYKEKQSIQLQTFKLTYNQQRIID